MYTFNLFWLADGMEHIGEGLWLADQVGHKMCDRLTELQMAVNAWVAFATKKMGTESNLKKIFSSFKWYFWFQYVFEMRVDGVTVLSELSPQATTLTNLKVRLSSHQFPAFPGLIYSERLLAFWLNSFKIPLCRNLKQKFSNTTELSLLFLFKPLYVWLKICPYRQHQEPI